MTGINFFEPAMWFLKIFSKKKKKKKKKGISQYGVQSVCTKGEWYLKVMSLRNWKNPSKELTLDLRYAFRPSVLPSTVHWILIKNMSYRCISTSGVGDLLKIVRNLSSSLIGSGFIVSAGKWSQIWIQQQIMEDYQPLIGLQRAQTSTLLKY